MATVADYLCNAAWVKRIEQLFDSLDTAQNGYVSKEEFHSSINRLALEVTDRPPELIEKLRKITVELTDAIGLGEGEKADKKKFLELVAAFAVCQKAKADKGEETVTEKHNVALYDVVDRHHDGNLTWDEYKLVMVSSGYDEAAARIEFDLLDTNKDGKIDRKKLASAALIFFTGL